MAYGGGTKSSGDGSRVNRRHVFHVCGSHRWLPMFSAHPYLPPMHPSSVPHHPVNRPHSGARARPIASPHHPTSAPPRTTTSSTRAPVAVVHHTAPRLPAAYAPRRRDATATTSESSKRPRLAVRTHAHRPAGLPAGARARLTPSRAARRFTARAARTFLPGTTTTTNRRPCDPGDRAHAHSRWPASSRSPTSFSCPHDVLESAADQPREARRVRTCRDCEAARRPRRQDTRACVGVEISVRPIATRTSASSRQVRRARAPEVLSSARPRRSTIACRSAQPRSRQPTRTHA